MRISDWSSDVCSSDLLEIKVAAMAATLEALRGRLGQTSELDAAAALTQQATDNLATLNGAVAEMLQHGAARESKLAEISRIHGAILGEIGRASCRVRVCPYV